MESYSRLSHLWRNANGVLYIVYSDRGIWRRRSTKTKKLAVAQLQLRTFVDAGGAEGRPARRLTFAQAAQEWFADRSAARYGLRPVTLTEYRISVRRVSELAIGKLWLDEIKPRDVRELLAQVEARGATPSMQAWLLLHVRMMFRWLGRDELANGNPAEMVSPRATSAAGGRR